MGKLFVYGPLRNSLGMSRVRVAYTAGEAIGPDLFVFYRSLGINLKQLHGCVNQWARKTTLAEVRSLEHLHAELASQAPPKE